MNRSDRELAIVGGVLILGAMLTRTREAIAFGDGWHWPVPDLNLNGVTYRPVITSGFRSSSRPDHHGVDIMYRRRTAADLVQEFPPREADAEGGRAHPQFFAPIGTPVLAARDGIVWSTGRIATGNVVVLDHGKPWATAYFHLQSINLPAHRSGRQADGSAAMHVRAGDMIGLMGFAPNDSERLRHLHFEAWFKGGSGAQAGVDPEGVMESTTNAWGRSTWRP